MHERGNGGGRLVVWIHEGSPLEDEVTRGPASASLSWSGPTRRSAIPPGQGGIYLVQNRHGTVLKVGQAGDFKQRFKDYAKLEKKHGPLRFYLGDVRTRGSVGAVPALVEHALTRVLLRSGLRLPEHKRPRKAMDVVGAITVNNILPSHLAARLQRAYTAPRDGATYRAPAAVTRGTLRLTPKSHPQWEVHV